jgi:hypothetical protein
VLVSSNTGNCSYEYPFDFSAADRQDAKKVSETSDRRLKELNGFVIFDESNHYQIDAPKGWNWVDVKEKA